MCAASSACTVTPIRRSASAIRCVSSLNSAPVSVTVVTGSCGLIGSESALHFGRASTVVGVDNDMRAAFFMERGYPHTMCVNRNGERFVNEAISYNDFGAEMIADQKRTGANTPCWMIFDATARWRYPIGVVMPPVIMPDLLVPREWWDNVLYKANSIQELARKIEIDPAALQRSVERMNGFAERGVDEEFHRGENAYDMVFGDPRNAPNPCLGKIEKAPFYAIPIDLGDIGTKGGLRTNENANVLRADGTPIEGLYATGNVSGAITYDSYPGAGGTIGPAMTFGMVAAEHIAQRNSNRMGARPGE